MTAVDAAADGVVRVQLRVIDSAESKRTLEPTAEQVVLNWNLADLKLDAYEVLDATAQQPPFPPPVPPQTTEADDPPPPMPPPAAPPAPPPLCEATGVDALAMLVNISEACELLETAVGWWRLLLLALAGGGVVIAALLGVLWRKVLEPDEQQSILVGAKGEEEEKKEDAGKQKKKKSCVKRAFRAVKGAVAHPVFSLWRSTLAGELDLLTDVILARSLWHAAALVPDDDFVLQLALASMALIGTSILFCCVGVLSLYFTMAKSKALSRKVFGPQEGGVVKASFFALILLAATVNVNLATLLPWRNEKRKSSTLAPETYRGQALRRIRYLHTASKVVEDLPQLVIASLYLVHTNVFGGSADDAAAAAAGGDDAAGRGAIGAAVLQIAISGLSFTLMMLWQCVQIADDRGGVDAIPGVRALSGERKRTNSPRSPTSPPKYTQGPRIVKYPVSKEVAVGGAAGGADDDSGAVNTDFSNTEKQVTAFV